MRTLFFLCVLVLMTSSPTFAGHHEKADKFQSDVNVSVNGLVCDFCARALEKVFGKRDEVSSINVDLDNHLVSIDLKDGANMADEDIKKLITDSGYNVVEIKHVGQE